MKRIAFSGMLLMFTSFSGPAQSLPVVQVSTTVGHVTVVLEGCEQTSSVGDTLTLALHLFNNDSTRSIAVIDTREYLPPRDEERWAVFSGGGNWTYDPDFYSQVSLLVLKARSSLRINFPVVINALRAKSSVCPPAVKENGRMITPTRYLSIILGYYEDDGLLKQLDLTSLKREGFRDLSKGAKFEAGLKSILVGPYPFVVKQDKSQ